MTPQKPVGKSKAKKDKGKQPIVLDLSDVDINVDLTEATPKKPVGVSKAKAKATQQPVVAPAPKKAPKGPETGNRQVPRTDKAKSDGRPKKYIFFLFCVHNAHA